MKAQELRIGNEVADLTGGTCIVRGVTSKGIWIKDKGGPASEDAFKPIPITPEWLDGRGLRYLQNACWELGSYRIYNVSGDRPRFRITIAGHEIVVVSYVHQLQNLFFDLTGKEL